MRNFDWEENSSTGRNQEYLVLKGQALVELGAGMYYLEASGRLEKSRRNRVINKRRWY